jgi:hypothetical protein
MDDSLLIKQPDSILNNNQRKRKIAILYLDSMYIEQLITSQRKSILLANSPNYDQAGKPITINYSTNEYREQVNPNQKEGIIITRKPKPFIPKPSIHTEPFQRRRDTSLHQKMLLDFAIKNIAAFDTSMKQIKAWHLPGKLIAIGQTISFLKAHPFKIVTGDGIGNFSSKLAFRATGLKIAGSYPESFTYINPDFLNNHLNIYLNYFSKDRELHSLINSPDSIYDQLIAEYGLVGIICFIAFYLAFFIKEIKKLTYGIPLLLLFLGISGIGYWFEQLSVVIIFELLMLLNIKETKVK